MSAQNAIEIKEKILRTLRIRGPSIPVYLAKEAGQSILFTSAFLSELFSEKKIKQSNLRVGSSPVYFIQGQEPALEKFSIHLKSREKDAFAIIKEKKFLIDEEQDPAIRVALRAIKDFAVPFQKEDQLIWRYFTIPEDDFKKEKEIVTPKIALQQPPIKKELELTAHLTNNLVKQVIEQPTVSETSLDIFDKKQETKSKVKTPARKKSVIRKKTSQKKNDRFFDKVKEFLSEKNIEILDIQSFSKNDLTLRIKKNNEDKLLVAYNKRRITESDLTKAHKKAQSLNLRYIILNLGETPKKLDNLITAVKGLETIEKIE